MNNNPLLAGLRVIDLSRLLPGPYCTMLLAQMGAEIIKIEDPDGGDYTRSLSPELFAQVNAGKRSVSLDLKQADDVEALKRLVAEADVLVESFRPGVLARLGLDFDTLRADNPKLVLASLTGYGDSGPYRDRPGHDMNYLGYAGVLDQTGSRDTAPVQCGLQIADLAGGALSCALGILGAVIGARASGHGCAVDSAMLDGSLALQAVSLGSLRATGQIPPRGEDMLTGGLPNYSVYPCADGYVAVGALEPKFFFNFCAAVSRPDLAKMPMAPGEKGEPLRQALAELFASRTRAEWDELLGDADCCVSVVRSAEEALEDPQIVARGMVERDAEGKPRFAHALRYDGQRPPSLGPPPALGADNAALLGR